MAHIVKYLSVGIAATAVFLVFVAALVYEFASDPKDLQSSHSDGSNSDCDAGAVDAACDGISAKLTSFQDISDFINDHIVPDNIRSNLKELTKVPHMAGTEADQQTAEWVKNCWADQGLSNVRTISYEVLLCYPDDEKPNMVRLLSDTKEILYESHPKQKPLYAPEEYDDTVTYNFHAFAPKGHVSSGLVYANYGTEEDFQQLIDMGINVTGHIVIAKYGKIFRGNIVSLSAENGAVGTILYSDPADYAEFGPEDVYPNTVMLPPTGAQLGAVRTQNGDPTTPYYPSIESAFRAPEDEWGMPKIPSQPISYEDAYVLLSSLSGPVAPDKWQGALNFTYHIGPQLVNDEIVDLEVNNILTNVTLQDVIGTIPGVEEPDRYVMVGNHRDAWVFGGIDPSSGTAAMVEASRVLMELMNETEWRPRRSIVFNSWAAEEFGLMGSFEFTEQFTKLLTPRAVAYLNMDQAIKGNTTFYSKATPLLYDLLYNATKQVPNPNPDEVKAGRATVYDTWLYNSADENYPDRPYINNIASGSDYNSFQQVLGISSLGMRYTDPKFGDPLYHTLYETFELVDELYDPGFFFQSAVTSVWAHMIVNTASSQVLPMSTSYYPPFLSDAVKTIEEVYGDLLASESVSLDYLKAAIDNFQTAVDTFIDDEKFLNVSNELACRNRNDDMMMVERSFIDPKGLPNRPEYLHVVTSPSDHNIYGGSAFPGLTDTLYTISVAQGDTTELWQDFNRHLAACTLFVNSAGAVLSNAL